MAFVKSSTVSNLQKLTWGPRIECEWGNNSFRRKDSIICDGTTVFKHTSATLKNQIVFSSEKSLSIIHTKRDVCPVAKSVGDIIKLIIPDISLGSVMRSNIGHIHV